MGEAADRVGSFLRERLAASLPSFSWETEYRVGRTPVDVVGRHDGTLVLVELEWRRADPADNPVKLFRHVDEGRVGVRESRSDSRASQDASRSGAGDRVLLVQAFSRYYDLADGGHSAKRKNAEFAGRKLARAVDRVDYASVTLDVEPVRGDADPPDGWREAVDAVVREVETAVREETGVREE